MRETRYHLSMNKPTADILIINAGSSSLKFAVYDPAHPQEPTLSGSVIRIGLPDTQLVIHGTQPQPVTASDHAAAAQLIIKELPAKISAIGHRVVHGGPHFSQPTAVTPDVLASLRELAPFDPEHLPAELALISQFQEIYPDIPQIASFDTGFYADLPEVAQLIALPVKYREQGARRYGFHGLSYRSILQQNPELQHGRVILAHLGSGVSLTAVLDGKPVDTTMGLTPAGGVPMSTRSGDIDPGLVLYLQRTAGLDAKAFNKLVNFESGLLGLSGRSADMEQLLTSEADDPQAKLAVNYFCYQVRKAIGALTTTLGGLDTLVFAGGMGEEALPVREQICAGLEYLGVTYDGHASSGDVDVQILHTDEAATILTDVQTVLEGL